MFRKNDQHGFYLIGLLIVLVIIGYLTYDGYFGASPGQQSTYQYAMGKTNNVDCSATRTMLKTNAMSWMVKNQGQAPTLDELYAAGAPKSKCRDKGVYSIGTDGEIYCSVHYPDPNAAATPTPAPAK